MRWNGYFLKALYETRRECIFWTQWKGTERVDWIGLNGRSYGSYYGKEGGGVTFLSLPHASCLVSRPTGGIYIPSSERFVQSLFDFDISPAILFLISF